MAADRLKIKRTRVEGLHSFKLKRVVAVFLMMLFGEPDFISHLAGVLLEFVARTRRQASIFGDLPQLAEHIVL